MTTITSPSPFKNPLIEPVHPELLRAAEIIRERGWAKEDYETDDGRVCLVGAVQIACGCEEDEDLFWTGTGPAARRYVELVQELWMALRNREKYGSVESWNDQRNRKKQDVLEFLERVGWGI